MKTSFKKLVIIGLALMIFVGSIYNGAGAIEIFAAVENVPTIRMGDNAPMTLDEFMGWRDNLGFRHINIDGRIYPASIFFNGGSGQSFSYGELRDGILYVFPRPDVISENRNVYVPAIPCEEEIRRSNPDLSPVIFTELAPIMFSYDELTAMMERVPHQNSLDTRSEITLPNRHLTAAEAWIAEYNEMGGATAFEIGVVREVNRVRERYGLRPLALDPALMMSARMKAQEFGDLQYFAHTSPVHGSPFQAARMLGFEGLGVPEAITRSGSNSPNAPVFRSSYEGIVAGMLASSLGHREILLRPSLYSVGFGSFFSPNSTGPNGNMTHMFYHVTKFGFHD